MRVLIAASLLLAVAQAQIIAPLVGFGMETRHPKEFMVVVESPKQFKTQLNNLHGSVIILREHNIGKWHGVLVEASQRSVKAFRGFPGVKLVETNHVIHLDEGVEKKKKATDVNLGESTLENHTIRKSSDPPREYIVRVRGGKDELAAVLQRHKQDVFTQTYQVVKELHVYAMQALVIKMDLESAEIMRKDPDVVLVEENVAASLYTEEFDDWEDDWATEGAEDWTTESSVHCVKQETRDGLWGLARITSSNWQPADHDSGFEYSEINNGEGVDVYVVDSGVYESHEDFEGRATWGYVTQRLRYEGMVDLNGHGTMVASLAAGKIHGVAKKANVIAVKCFDVTGTTSIADIIESVEWVHQQITSKKKKRSVVNMSLGVNMENFILEGAVQSAIEDGVVFVIAAGNSARDACEFSPAKVSAAITVGASNLVDVLASFSNFGPCINIIAPGEAIQGAGIASSNSIVVESGTSMAAPFVAGVIATYLSSLHVDQRPTALEVKAFVMDSALPGVMQYDSLFDKSTPNLLLHMECNNDIVTPTMLPPRNASEEDCNIQESRSDNWHLSRIASRGQKVNYNKAQYSYSSSDDGSGVDVYVMDSGIYLEHSEFEGRAKWGMTASDVSEAIGDYNGHGTHVASLVGGKTHGVAKKVNIIAVKVFDKSGAGSATSVLEGIAWIASDVESKRKSGKKRRAVVNMSLGFSVPVYLVEGAITELIAAGTTVVAAAGNSFRSSCTTCPARMASVITVAASSIDSKLTWFSNFGSCVDIVAPGDDILGAGIGSPNKRALLSGTSQSSPIVAGAVARFLSSFEEETRWPTPAEVQTYLVDQSNRDILSLLAEENATPNVELYAGCAYSEVGGAGRLATPSFLYLLLLVLAIVCLDK